MWASQVLALSNTSHGGWGGPQKLCLEVLLHVCDVSLSSCLPSIHPGMPVCLRRVSSEKVPVSVTCRVGAQ